MKIMRKVHSKHILKAEPTGLADSFNFACERKRAVKFDYKVLG